MAIQTTYNFKGIEVNNVYIRVDRLWGSSREGWTALVGVYNITIEEDETVYNKIDEFNHSCIYSDTERGYMTMYNSLKEEFGGVEC